jgi:hypothetical protein
LIDILDDDSLLHLFYLYRPAIFDGDESDDTRSMGGKGWDRERWWIKLAQVCQRWRKLILGSTSYLGLCLVCTYGTPVADMLAHSPPLPLIIDYFDDRNRDIAAEDEDGIILALEKRDRVRRVRLEAPVRQLQKLIIAVDEEYPVLEYLVMLPSTVRGSKALILPDTFQAPHLCHLALRGFTLPMESRFLTTAAGLVTLCLFMGHPSAYFQPNTLLQWISFMPQLETLFLSVTHPGRDVETQLMHTPIVTHVTLPNLRLLEFRGVSAYMEAVVCQITTPCLQKLVIRFPGQITFSTPRLLQLMNTTENLRFDSAKFVFSWDNVYLEVYPPEETEMYSLSVLIYCLHLDWQASSMAQIFDSSSQIFSTVQHLTLKREAHSLSYEEYNMVDRSEWHKLFRSFSNVKTLRVDDGLVKGLSRSLRQDDGELPLDLLPDLQELAYSGSGDTDGAFASFIDSRQNAGRPVTLVCPSPRSLTPLSRSSSPRFFELSPVFPSPAGSSVSGSDLVT